MDRGPLSSTPDRRRDGRRRTLEPPLRYRPRPSESWGSRCWRRTASERRRSRGPVPRRPVTVHSSGLAREPFTLTTANEPPGSKGPLPRSRRTPSSSQAPRLRWSRRRHPGPRRGTHHRNGSRPCRVPAPESSREPRPHEWVIRQRGSPPMKMGHLHRRRDHVEAAAWFVHVGFVR